MRLSRAAWMLGGTALALVGVVAAGTVVEHTSSPPSPPQLPDTSVWPEAAAGPSNPAVPSNSAASSAAASSSKVAAPTKYVFPVGATKVSYAHTHHDYPASDIISACGSPVLATTDGVILEVSREDDYNAKADDGALRGGLFISLLGDDGVRYYGSHLRLVLTGIDGGVRVTAGEKLGEVGDTGDAGVCHLHFGISPVCARTGDWWVRRGVIFPWSYLDAWRAGKAQSPVTEIAAWTKKNGCPGAPS